jgi:predicted ATPase/DNA-binding SARP family transcriptional activator
MDVEHATDPSLRFRDLGPLLVERAGEPVPLGGARLTSALSLLLIRTGRHVGVDALTEAMWGAEARPRSSSTLDSHVWRLRKALEPDRGRGEPPRVLRHDAAGFRLVVEPGAVDSVRFEQLAGETRELLADGRAGEAVRRAEEALALWRGRPYAAVADEPWAAAAVARLQELRGQLRERLVEALLAVGDPERALVELETSVAEAPLRERVWALRMLAQHRSGRTEQALRTYQQAREVLLDELGLEPGPELRELHAQILDPATAPPAPRPVPEAPEPGEVHLPHRLPALVGRDEELTRVADLVRTGPLVTVVGAAGCGKTRLAIEVARTAADGFPDGVFFVDLTAASDVEQVVSAVASALGFASEVTERPRPALTAFLARRRTLLLLDNCEHVLDPVAEVVEEWLGGAATVLTTSREPLGLDGELVRAIEPLSTAATDGQDASSAPAVALLLDRLAAAGVDRSDLDVLSHAVRIAAAVDGVPLALELAAARARAFSLEEIAHQVSADPSALSRVGRGRDHHRTVRFAVEQSYAALPEGEARLHRRVCVLPGPFTLAAARGLGNPDDLDDGAETGDLLAWLVHRSLLAPLGPARPGGRSRFAQLATVRGHAAHAAAAELADLRDRRDDWVTGLVTARPRLGLPAEWAWYDALDDDLAALRATLQRTLVDEPSPRGVAIAGRLGAYWYFRSKVVEGSTWTERALRVEGADPLSRALVRLVLAHYLAEGGHPDLAAPHIAAALDAVEGGADARSPDFVEALVSLAVAFSTVRDVDRGRGITARITAAAAGDPHLELLAEVCAALGRGAVDALDAASAEVESLHDRAVAQQNRYAAAVLSGAAAGAAARAGDVERGLLWSDRMIAHRLALGTTDAPVALELRAILMAMRGDHREAVRLFAGSRAHALRNGLRWPATDVTTALLDDVTRAVGDTEARRARAEGARITLADVPAATAAPLRLA